MFSFFKRGPKKPKTPTIRLQAYTFAVENRLTCEPFNRLPLELTIWAPNVATAEQTAAELGFSWHTLLTGPKGY